MSSMRTRIAGVALALLLAGQVAVAPPGHAAREGFNDDAVYGPAKSRNDTDTTTPLKVPLCPATVILDVLFLPFAVVAGFVT